MIQAQTRRQVIGGIAAAAGTGLLRSPGARGAAGALETTTIRLPKSAGICAAPVYVAEELLRAEGFTDVRYVDLSPPELSAALGDGRIDFGNNYAMNLARDIDAGKPLTVIGGVMVGCTELFAREDIGSVAALKGKTLGTQALGALPNVLMILMAAEVGLDPTKDINWVTDPKLKPIELFIDGKIDAFIGFPPEPQELRARKIGHVLVNTALDRPWSQYFCCMLAGNSNFVRDYPVATKRVLRAVLKASDLCATDPARAARRIVDRGFTERYEYALETMNELPYDKWREYDSEDTMRFYALRLHAAGIIKSSPQKIIAEGTDWRFFNELKRELKA